MAFKTAAGRAVPPRAAAAPTTSGPEAGGGPVSFSAFRKGRKKKHAGAGIRGLFAFEIPPTAK